MDSYLEWVVLGNHPQSVETLTGDRELAVKESKSVDE